MKKYTAVLMSILLLTFGFSINSAGVFASTTSMQEKENIIQDLEIIKNSSDNKKTKKKIEFAIKQIEKSLDEKFWKDESTLNFKPGKKAINVDQKAIIKLDKILKDKKELDSIKEDIVQINLRIVEVDKFLLENGIDSLEDIIMSEKGIKKLDKARKILEKGNGFLEDENYNKAIKNYVKAWEQIKKSLKDPHFKKMKIVDYEGVGFLDNTFDDIPDVYVKISKSSKNNKPKQVEIKITNDCVNGIIHDEAAMKIGLSTPRKGAGILMSTDFFDEGFKATNKWFKQNDPDKRIDPVIITTISEYFDGFPITGDDLIQINPENQNGSFEFSAEPISEIGDQSGWIGKFTIDAEPGDYELHFWMPLTEPSNEGDSCNFIASFPIEQTFE